LKTKELTAKHLQLLIALQEGPMDRLETLSERVGMSRTSVSSYLKWLSGEENSGKRYFRVVPDFDEEALGLETIDVFFETPTIESIRYMETVCDDYPYTKYRARCYSGVSEVFAQFRIPKGARGTLEKYFKELKRKGGPRDYRILPTDNIDSLFTVPRLEYWNNNTFTWNFNWHEWLTSPVDEKSPFRSVRSESKVSLISKNDIYILSILPKGARRKQSQMIEELHNQGATFTSQEFSRRLKTLNEYFIPRYHVYVDIDAFDLYSNVIITANCDSKFSESLKKRLHRNPLPFRSTLKISESFMFWYLRLPPSHLSELLSFLHENVTNLQMSIVDYKKTEVYILWPEAFDENIGNWKRDDDFLLMK